MAKICEKCSKYAIYNAPGERPKFCATHKLSGMVDVISKRCAAPGCTKQPSFNVPGQPAKFCKDHKLPDMVNVVSKRCADPDCDKHPAYNVPGETVRLYCATHKLPGMIDVKNKKCAECDKIPAFNVPGQPAKYCGEHKQSGMVNVVSKRCTVPDCDKQPSYNVPGEKAKFCGEHKLPGMIDVVHKQCADPGCDKFPSYNVPGQPAKFCMEHKLPGMVDVISKRCAVCDKIASYNVPGQPARYCCEHTLPGMIDVVHRICPGHGGVACPVRTQLSRGNEYCLSCDPNDARRKQFKRYEEEFFEYVKDEIDVHKREFRVNFDQTMTDRKFARLDGIVLGDGVIVCLEVDEDGHRGYECDVSRMHLVNAELHPKYPGSNVSWVRVNPTVGATGEWSKKSKKIMNERFDEVIRIVHEILESRETRVEYVGFE